MSRFFKYIVDGEMYNEASKINKRRKKDVKEKNGGNENNIERQNKG